MNTLNIVDYTQALGFKAKQAAALMARAPAATKNIALRKLAGLLREEASEGAVRGRIEAAESAVTAANEALVLTPEAGPEPKRPFPRRACM